MHLASTQLELKPSPLHMASTLLDRALVQSPSLAMWDSLNVVVCVLLAHAHAPMNDSAEEHHLAMQIWAVSLSAS